MSRYKASGAERGCILDFVDYPLNNRWWLEDEFKAIGALPSEPEKLARLELLRTWEHPGAGSFYDDVGNIAKSPHVVMGDLSPLGLRTARTPIPEVLWWDDGASRKRLSWMDVMNWPLAMHYTGLDPKADYVIRTTGYGTCLLSIDGERVQPVDRPQGDRRVQGIPGPESSPGGRHIAPHVRTAGRARELAVSIEAVGTLAAEEVTTAGGVARPGPANTLTPAAGAGQIRMPLMTFAPSTPVSLASRPWNLTVKASWSMPSWCSIVAWRSWTVQTFSTAA